MNVEYCDLPFKNEIIKFEDLGVIKAIDFCNRLHLHPYCQLVSTHIFEYGQEGVVFDVEIESPQYPKFDIRDTERIAVIFNKDDKFTPEVYALRMDFPKAPHQNIQSFETPKCLCLYDQPYYELKLTWSSVSFLEQIRNWLKLTAKGKLHQDDQPLEPFLLGARGNIIFPPNFDINRPLYIAIASESPKQTNFVSSHFAFPNSPKTELSFSSIVLKYPPQVHGIINSIPKTLNELDKLLYTNKELIESIKERVKQKAKEGNVEELKSRLLLILHIPLSRDGGDSEKRNDFHVFISPDSYGMIGEKLNVLSKDTSSNSFVPLVVAPVTTSNEEVVLELLKPHSSFNAELGAKLNNLDVSIKDKFTIIGAGALGSQILMNLGRIGIGDWTIIDDDVFLPHNLSRHTLNDSIGFFKSETLSRQVNAMLGDENFSKGIVDNFISPKDASIIQNSISDSKVVVDCSASIAVARKLVNEQLEKGRCVSVFLNTTGTDLIILAEGIIRDIKLDILEMQYYRELINNDELSNHLLNNNGMVRYATSCRDLSSRIPQDYVALHSAIGTNFIKNIFKKENPTIGIWKINEDSLEVTKFDINPFPVLHYHQKGWDITIDTYLEDKLFKARKDKLPNETGGVLIGSYDLERKKIYIVETILSPKDSIERPDAYYRGIDGLKEKLDEIEKRTISNLRYIGEWHSHPPNVSLKMSADDKKHYDWVREHFEKMDLPPLTIIVGNGKYEIYNNLKKTDYD